MHRFLKDLVLTLFIGLLTRHKFCHQGHDIEKWIRHFGCSLDHLPLFANLEFLGSSLAWYTLLPYFLSDLMYTCLSLSYVQICTKTSERKDRHSYSANADATPENTDNLSWNFGVFLGITNQGKNGAAVESRYQRKPVPLLKKNKQTWKREERNRESIKRISSRRKIPPLTNLQWKTVGLSGRSGWRCGHIFIYSLLWVCIYFFHSLENLGATNSLASPQIGHSFTFSDGFSSTRKHMPILMNGENQLM